LGGTGARHSGRGNGNPRSGARGHAVQGHDARQHALESLCDIELIVQTFDQLFRQEFGLDPWDLHKNGKEPFSVRDFLCLVWSARGPGLDLDPNFVRDLLAAHLGPDRPYTHDTFRRVYAALLEEYLRATARNPG
jgi:hypothetical protein